MYQSHLQERSSKETIEQGQFALLFALLVHNVSSKNGPPLLSIFVLCLKVG